MVLWWETVRFNPIARNLLGDRPKPKSPNRVPAVWVGDITYVHTSEGWLYLAAIMDLYSRKIVGWATSRSLGTTLVKEALQQALVDRRPAAGLLHHSDNRDRVTGYLVAASFVHDSSRTLDPQLHTHFTVFNATFDEQERCWKALQARGMYDTIRYGTAVYRNELAKRAQQIGYRIVPVQHGFAIEGVNEAILKQFSKRAQQRDAVVKAMEAKLGRKLSNNEISHAVHQSRAKKINGISTAEVREWQLSQLSTDERQSLQALRTSARVSSLPRIALVEKQVLNHTVAHVFERKSMVPEDELLDVALSHRLGAVDLNHLKAAVKHLPNLVRTERGFSTQQIVATELSLIQTVNAGCDAFAPLHPGYSVAKTVRL